MSQWGLCLGHRIRHAHAETDTQVHTHVHMCLDGHKRNHMYTDTHIKRELCLKQNAS